MSIQKLVIAPVLGVAVLAHANPTQLTDALPQDEQAFAFDAQISSYILGVMGPSNIAPTQEGKSVLASSTDAHSIMLYQSMAGPSNAPSGIRMTRSLTTTAGSPDGPGDAYFTPQAPRPPLVTSLQPREYPTVITTSTASHTETAPGGFQVVVPLPGAGALAAAGLLVVGIRRRRA
ncbi:MAG: hypothetical protein ACIAQU_02805 [Phycisphaerales bacterium JB064]